MTDQFQLFPELAPADYAALRGDIAVRGVLVPVLIDQDGNLLDGHHRERIARELGVPVPTWQVECRNDDERRAVVRAVNLYRRHLTPQQRAEHIGALKGEGWSNRRIAEAAGVAETTVRRDVAAAPFVAPERVTGKDGKSYPAARTTPKMAVHYSSETAEWHTPAHVIAAVVDAMGAVDLDPCSNPGVPNVAAGQHFTIDDDGLARPWRGRVYMNPPYGGVIADWIEKLAAEAESGRVAEAIALVPARTDTGWWRRLPAAMVCFVAGRLRFSGSDPAPFPSAALYVGTDPSRFASAFRGLGGLYEPVA